MVPRNELLGFCAVLKSANPKSAAPANLTTKLRREIKTIPYQA